MIGLLINQSRELLYNNTVNSRTQLQKTIEQLIHLSCQSLTFIFVSLLYKTDRFHVAVFSVKDHKRRQTNGLCATFLFLPHDDLTSSVISDARRHGIYLLITRYM